MSVRFYIHQESMELSNDARKIHTIPQNECVWIQMSSHSLTKKQTNKKHKKNK